MPAIKYLSARSRSGSVAGTPSSFSTTMAFKNESGGATESSWVTPPFGHAFKPGDIPAGSYPSFAIGGTPIPYSYWNRVTHPDGSWAFAGFMLRIPQALSNGSTLLVSMTATASAPPNASVGLANLYSAGVDVQAVGHTATNSNLSGTWNATLSQAIAEASADITDLTSTTGGNGGGNVCKYYRIGIPFKQGGSEHASLYCYFWCFVMENASGGLYDISVLPGVMRPWGNRPGDTAWNAIAFSDVVLRRNSGATELQRPQLEIPTFEWRMATDSPVVDWRTKTIKRLTGGTQSTNGADNKSVALSFSTTGSLPGGMSTSKIYYTMLDHIDSGGEFCYPINEYGTGTDYQGFWLDFTGTGSGTHTATCLPWVGKFGCLWIAPTTADYTYLGIGTRGNAAPAACSPRPDTQYIIDTKYFIPVEQNVTETNPANILPKNRYYHGSHQPFYYFGETGSAWGQPGRGPTHNAVVEYISQSQHIDRYRNVCAQGLGAYARSVAGLDWNAKAFPTTNLTPDTGTGLSLAQHKVQDANYGVNGQPTGWNAPTSTLEAYKFYGGMIVRTDQSHAAEMYSGYTFTGRDEHLFATLGNHFFRVNGKSFAGGIRHELTNYTWDGTAYTGIGWTWGGQLRDSAWLVRDLIRVIQYCPDIHPHRTEALRLKQQHRDFLLQCYASQNANAAASGHSPVLVAAFPNAGPWYGESFTGRENATQDWGLAAHDAYGVTTFAPKYLQIMTLQFMRAFYEIAFAPIVQQIANFAQNWGTNYNGGTHNWLTASTYPCHIGNRVDTFDFAAVKLHLPYSRGNGVTSNPDPGASWGLVQLSAPRTNAVPVEWTWDGSTDTITWYDIHLMDINDISNGDCLYLQHYWISQAYLYGELPRPGGVNLYTRYYIGNLSSNGNDRSFKLYRDTGLTDLVDITDSTSTWRVLALNYDTSQIKWIAMGPNQGGGNTGADSWETVWHATDSRAFTGSGGGTGTASLYRWFSQLYTYEFSPQLRNTLFLKNCSGAFTAGDTVTQAQGSRTATIGEVRARVPIFWVGGKFKNGWKYVSANSTHMDPHFTMINEVVMNLTTDLGVAPPAQARTNHDSMLQDAATRIGWSLERYRATYPHFRTKIGA